MMALNQNNSLMVQLPVTKSDLDGKTALEDRKLARFIVFYFFIKALNLSIKQIFPISTAYWSLISNVFMVLIVIDLLFSIKIVFRRAPMAFLFTELLFMFLLAFSYLMGTSVSLLIPQGFQTVAVCVPIGLHVYCMRNKNVLLECFYKSSFAFTVILCYTLFVSIGGNRETEYSMSASYALLPAVLAQYNEFYNRGNGISLIAALIGTVAILLFGARGPLLCIPVFLIIKIFSARSEKKWKICTVIVLAAAAYFLIFHWDQIASWALDVLKKNRISSRTLQKIFAGGIDDLLEPDGRDSLFRYYFKLILERPVIGWGLFGGWIGSGSGPHNMLTETVLAFGLFFGGLLCIVFIVLWIWATTLSLKGSDDSGLLLIFSASVFKFYLYSGDGFSSVEWFLFLFLLLGRFREKA